MTTHRPLWPPLEAIEHKLFAPSDNLLDRWERDDPGLDPELRRALDADPAARRLRGLAPEAAAAPTELPAPPPDLADRIHRVAAARAWDFGPLPQPGQILSIEATAPLDWDLPSPLAVVLDQPADTPGVWWGWLAAPETDYAGPFDLVLTDEDAPFDPRAGMIQVWNPVYVNLANAGRVLGRLSPARRAAAAALGRGFLTGDSPAAGRPGRVQVRELAGGHSVLTGSGLGGAQDPRRRYQRLYHAAAEALRAPARALLAAAPADPLERLYAGLLAAVRRAGRLLEPAPEVAHAMGGPDPADSLLLDRSLRLRPARAGAALRLDLERLTGDWRITRLEDGAAVEGPFTLDAGAPRRSLYLSPGRQHRLRLLDPAGNTLELPLDWDGEIEP